MILHISLHLSQERPARQTQGEGRAPSAPPFSFQPEKPPRRPSLVEEEQQKKNKKGPDDEDQPDPTASSSGAPRGHAPALPLADDSGEGESDDSDLDSQATVPHEEAFDVIIDECYWSFLTGPEKVCSNTASCCFPMFHECPFDVFTVKSTQLKPRVPLTKRTQGTKGSKHHRPEKFCQTVPRSKTA